VNHALAEALTTSQLGSSVQIPTGAGIAFRPELCRVQVPSELACGWTVTLGATDNARLAAAGAGAGINTDFYALQQARPFAVVTWGTSGAQFRAEVDWRNGQSFGVWGSWAAVQFRLGRTYVNIAGAAYPNARIGAALTPAQPSHRAMPVTRSYVLGDIIAGSTLGAAVPPHAERVVHLYSSATNADEPRRLRFVDNTGDLRAMVNFTTTNFQGSGVWVPHDTEIVELQNTSLVTLLDVQLIFLLSL
jgi:hypothetical protein